jgi:ABC-type Zn uptake system ZnuABC Zn-binding protein ZnuA
MRWTGVFVALLLMAVMLSPAYALPGDVKVAVTINVIEDMVKQIGGDRVDVTSIVTGLENPHTYSFTTEDRETVASSDLFIEIGMGLEPWAEELSSDLPSDRVLVLSDNCTKIGSNPHVWMDPENGKAMAWDIAKKLCSIDPEGTEYYMHNLRRFTGEISYAEVRARSLGAEVAGSGVITATPGFSYLLRTMNISEVHTLVTTPGSAPSAGDIAECEDAVRSGEAYALIDLAQSPSPAIEQIADDTGAVVVVGTPLLGVLGLEHYTELIVYNAQAIHDGILDGERNRDMNLLENRVDGLSMQVKILAVFVLFLGIVAVAELIQIRRLRRGDF